MPAAWPISPSPGPIVTWLIESVCSNVDSTVARLRRGVSGTIQAASNPLRSDWTRLITNVTAAATTNEPVSAIVTRAVTWTATSQTIHRRCARSSRWPWRRWNHHGTTMPRAADVQPTTAIHVSPDQPGHAGGPRSHEEVLLGVPVVGLAGTAGEEDGDGEHDEHRTRPDRPHAVARGADEAAPRGRGRPPGSKWTSAIAATSHRPSSTEIPPARRIGRRSDTPPSRNAGGTATSAAAEANRLARRNSVVSATRSGSPSSPVSQATVAPLVNV